jgi:hypothetical protein
MAKNTIKCKKNRLWEDIYKIYGRINVITSKSKRFLQGQVEMIGKTTLYITEQSSKKITFLVLFYKLNLFVDFILESVAWNCWETSSQIQLFFSTPINLILFTNMDDFLFPCHVC